MISAVLENQLRQKVIQFEESLARIADTRKHLRDNADLVKSEIRATFGTQLTQMRRREQQLLETLDTVASVKDGILSDQQDHLHQALGACLQGLEWYQTAIEDMKENRLSSMDTVEHHINDVLKKLSVVDMKPRETAALSFEADSLAIRKTISSFGHVRTGKSTNSKSFESLPAQLEDYEDEDMVHSLLHKALNHQGKNATTIFVGRPVLSNDPKDWLLREALTGHHSAPVTPEHGHDSDQSAMYTKHCATGTDSAKGNELRQAQVHSWLHHIKNQVENEPHIFEDFEIVKDREVKNSMPVDSIKAELSDDIAAVFRPYFEAVLMSPANQWLLKSMENVDFNQLSSVAGNVANIKADPMVRDYVVDGDVEDMDSCPSTITYESSGVFVDPGGTSFSLTQEAYAKLWSQFVDTLWSSTDSLWILPCCSEETPKPLATESSGQKTWGQPMAFQSQNFISVTTDRLLANLVESISLGERQPKPDHDQWLLRSPDHPPTLGDHRGFPLSTSGQMATVEPKSYEEWLGWKALLEKMRRMGDQYWLYQPPANRKSDLDHLTDWS